jgi:hypothetical protein
VWLERGFGTFAPSGTGTLACAHLRSSTLTPTALTGSAEAAQFHAPQAPLPHAANGEGIQRVVADYVQDGSGTLRVLAGKLLPTELGDSCQLIYLLTFNSHDNPNQPRRIQPITAGSYGDTH